MKHLDRTLDNDMFGKKSFPAPVVMGDESIMVRLFVCVYESPGITMAVDGNRTFLS
jgi:hypothetical protein